MIIVKYTLALPNALPPERTTDGAACFDLFVAKARLGEGLYDEYDSGVIFEIPPGYHGKLFARSSVSKKGLVLCNSCGIIDADYRGTVRGRFYLVSGASDMSYAVGDRFAQILFERNEDVEFVQVDHLTATARGAGGFGSTDVRA